MGAKPGLNFNPGFIFFRSKAFFPVIFSILFSRASNHQIVDKKNKTEFSFQAYISEFKFRTNPGLFKKKKLGMGHNPKTIFVNKTIYNMIELRACVLSKFHSGTSNRKEKSFRHVALVAILLDDNKPKINLKSKFALFQTSSILFNSIHFV